LQKLEQAARASTGNDATNCSRLAEANGIFAKADGHLPTGIPRRWIIAEGTAETSRGGQGNGRQKLALYGSREAKMSRIAFGAFETDQEDGGCSCLKSTMMQSLPWHAIKPIWCSKTFSGTTDLEKMRDRPRKATATKANGEDGQRFGRALKNGQPEAAQMTLQKMERNMKSAICRQSRCRR